MITIHPEQSNLESILTTIDGILGIDLDNQDGNAISERLSVCAALLSTSANSVATSQLIYSDKMNEMLDGLNPKMSATDKKMILQAKLGKEAYWVKYAERQNAALVHAIDSYRSLLSYLKEDMKMSYLQGNQQNR